MARRINLLTVGRSALLFTIAQNSMESLPIQKVLRFQALEFLLLAQMDFRPLFPPMSKVSGKFRFSPKDLLVQPSTLTTYRKAKP
jgi:hypothetical protein